MITSPLSLLERIVCGVFRTAPYCALSPTGHAFTDVALGEARRDARYYALSNGLRGAVLALMVIPFRQAVNSQLFLVAAGSAAHFVVSITEVYRLKVLMRLKLLGRRSDPNSAIEAPAVHPYFGPHRWESLSVYQWFGVERARKAVHGYKRWSRDEGSSRLGPQPNSTATRAFALVTIRNSKQAEITHLIGLTFDFVILYGSLHVPGIWWIIPIIGLYIDVEMILLQRTHRVRLRRMYRHSPCNKFDLRADRL